MPDHSLYDAHYHDEKSAATRRAADAVLPIVCSVIDVTSVLDVGCGYGDWLASARALGIDDVTGIEGGWAAAWRARSVLATEFELVLCDLEVPLRLDRAYDLVVCIEVAEHLTPARGPSFVADLCAAGGAVLLGAAIPGQTGPNHVNERWPSEWASEFARHDYRPLDCIRPRIWGDPTLWPHHRQNPILFVTEDAFFAARERADALADPEPSALDLVLPDLYRREPESVPALTLREHLRQLPAATRRSLGYHVMERWRRADS